MSSEAACPSAATCPISLEPIPEGAAFEIDGTVFDIRSVLDMVLVQGFMASHPYTRQPIPREAFRRLHSAAMALPETRAQLQSQALGAWPEFVRRMSQLGSDSRQELMQSSVEQAFETAWSRMIDRVLEFGDDWVVRLHEQCRSDIIELVFNTIRIHGHNQALRYLMALIDRRCESTACIESISRMHRIATLITGIFNVMPSLGVDFGTHAAFGTTGGPAYDIVQAPAYDIVQAAEEEEGAAVAAAEEEGFAHRLQHASPIQQMFALGFQIFGRGVVGGAVLGDVVERTPPVWRDAERGVFAAAPEPRRGSEGGTMGLRRRLPEQERSSDAEGSEGVSPAAGAAGAAEGSSLMHSATLLPADTQAATSVPAAAAAAAGTSVPAAAAAASATAAEPSSASLPLTQELRERSSDAEGSERVPPLMQSFALSQEPVVMGLRQPVQESVAMNEWLMLLVDLVMAPEISTLNSTSQAFVTARLQRTINTVARRWGAPDAEAREVMTQLIATIEQETGRRSQNLELLRELLSTTS
jgi:hypothetical protein